MEKYEIYLYFLVEKVPYPQLWCQAFSFFINKLILKVLGYPSPQPYPGAILPKKIYDTQHRNKALYANCGQHRPWSACTFTQADQGIRCPLTESMDTVVYVDEQRRMSCLDQIAPMRKLILTFAVRISFSHLAYNMNKKLHTYTQNSDQHTDLMSVERVTPYLLLLRLDRQYR